MNALKYFGLACSLATLSLSQMANAQSGAPSTRQAPAVVPQRYVRVRNIQPSTIAWWLQPELHPEPLMFAQSRENARLFFGQKAAAPLQSNFKAPEGLIAIVPRDAQNALLVLGDEAAIAEVEKAVALLDKPLRQVEVVALMLQCEDTAAAAELGIDLTAETGPRLSAQPLSPLEFNATLKRLVAAKRANIVIAPRVTVSDTLTAALHSWRARPAHAVSNGADQVSIAALPAPGKETPVVRTSPEELFLTDSFGIAVTPKIIDDGTVSLQLQIGKTLRLQDGQSGDSVRLRSMASIQPVAVVRDGETIVLGGLVTRPQSTLSTAPAAEAPLKTPITLFLVTTRILRRLDETAGRPAVPVPNQEWREAMRREAAKRGAIEKATP